MHSTLPYHRITNGVALTNMTTEMEKHNFSQSLIMQHARAYVCSLSTCMMQVHKSRTGSVQVTKNRDVKER